mgnify:CR=1 FL=1
MAVETLTFNTVRETLTINGQSFAFNCSASTASTGDMLASVYDPTGVVGDAFDMGNMAEDTDAKVMTAAERSGISANTSARHTQGTDQGLDTGGANAVTAAQTKAAYTHSGVVTGNPHSVTAAQASALALNATGALGDLTATPAFTGVDGTIYTAAYSASVTSWAGITLASGAGIGIGPIPNAEPWTAATTGLTAIESGALDDIAAPGVVLWLANLGGTIYGRASLPA